MHIVCFDTETTGLEPQKDHIIQLSLVKFDTETWNTIDTRDWYILPEGPFTIPAAAEAVHHISKAFLQEKGLSLRAIVDDIIDFTNGCNMLSYNGNGFDAPILHYNLARIERDFNFEGRTWFDALLLERIHMAGQIDPTTGEKYKCTLTDAYTRYYGHPFEGAHNSLDDVLATIQVFKAQIEQHGWEWAQREEFDFISYDRWLTKKGNYFFLCMGAHKGESIESMLRIDKSYLEWMVDKCQWTDSQTKDIINPYLNRQNPTTNIHNKTENPTINSAENTQQANTTYKKPTPPKGKPKPSISDADLTLF